MEGSALRKVTSSLVFGCSKASWALSPHPTYLPSLSGHTNKVILAMPCLQSLQSYLSTGTALLVSSAVLGVPCLHCARSGEGALPPQLSPGSSSFPFRR